MIFQWEDPDYDRECRLVGGEDLYLHYEDLHFSPYEDELDDDGEICQIGVWLGHEIVE